MTFTEKLLAFFGPGFWDNFKEGFCEDSDTLPETEIASVDLCFTPEYDDIHNQAHLDFHPHHPVHGD